MTFFNVKRPRHHAHALTPSSNNALGSSSSTSFYNLDQPFGSAPESNPSFSVPSSTPSYQSMAQGNRTEQTLPPKPDSVRRGHERRSHDIFGPYTMADDSEVQLWHRKRGPFSRSSLAGGLHRLMERATLSRRPTGRSSRDQSTQAEQCQQTPRSKISWHRRAATLGHGARPATAIPAATYAPATTRLPEATPLSSTQADNLSLLNNPTGGAAARAAAAAENERSGLGRLLALRATSEVDRDTESGIGIEVRRSVGDVGDLELTRKDPVMFLPPELTAHFLAYLDHSSLVNAELVSKAWHDAASSHHVWREVFLNQYKRGVIAPPSDLTAYDTTGKGLGKQIPDQDWKKFMRVRQQLQSNWENAEMLAGWIEGHSDSVYCAQFDEDKIITGSRDKTVRIWDIRTYQTIKILGASSNVEPSAAVTPSSQPTTSENGVLTVQPSFSAPTSSSPTSAVPPSNESKKHAVPSMYHDASILCLQFDSEILVTGSSDATCIVWSIKEDYKPIRRLMQHRTGVLDVCFDSKRIVTCSKDHTLCVWDRETLHLVRQMVGHRGPVNAVQMRGNLVVSTSGDAQIKLWNLDAGKCIKEFAGHTRGLACVQLSEDCRWIVSGGNDHVIRVWDATSGECVRELHGHQSLVRALHLDSATGRIISGSYDQSIKVFDMHTGRLLIDFPRWTTTQILCTKADYRRVVATSSCGKTFVMDFGEAIHGIGNLEVSANRLEEIPTIAETPKVMIEDLRPDHSQLPRSRPPSSGSGSSEDRGTIVCVAPHMFLPAEGSMELVEDHS